MPNLLEVVPGWNVDQLAALLHRIGEANALSLLKGELEITFQVLKRVLATVTFLVARFIDADWQVWRGPVDSEGLEGEEDCDPRSLTLTEIDWAKVRFLTCLRDGEDHIEGEESYRRLKESGDILLGGNAFHSLWLDYVANGKNGVLEWLYQTRGISLVDFFGLILRGPTGDRYVLSLYRRGDGQWFWDATWIAYNGNVSNVASLAS